MDGTPEFRLFCLALRHPLAAPDRRAMGALADAGIDWDAVVSGARRHRVAARVLAGLKASDTTPMPAWVLADLQQQAFAAARRSLLQVAEVARLQRAFEAEGLRVLFLKGVVLAAALHGDATRCDARDIDLLAGPDQLAGAAELITRLGYRRHEPGRSPRQTAEYRRRIKDIEFQHVLTRAPLELHHRLTDNPHLLPAEFARLWDERESVRVGDATVPTLPRSMLPLYLCVHGAGHAWERLRWLVDFAASVKSRDGVDAALRHAEAAGLETPMLHALALAQDWLALPVADAPLARARASIPLRRLDRLLAHLYAGAAWHALPERGTRAGLARYSLWQRLYRLSLKPDWTYRFAQARREWFTPTDWQTFAVPDALFFLYPMMRPFAWLARRRQR